ncbi:MAG TPA: TrmH family RNA methyltransferase [Elusimicrobiota bacterium]|nr:TrmH family RNA methyltransferase [Elusimicrobiota bacterium]
MIRFVLVRPSNALNIGAVARAMANFGLEDLVAVSPYPKRWRTAHSAIYGSALLDRARRTTLDEAVSDCHLVLGTASAHNRALRRTMVTLPALRGFLKRRLPKGGRLAVLFGSERNGLENEELSHCHALLRIPTQPDAPSMNLGQAAAVVAYALAEAGLERSVEEPADELLDGAQLEGLVEVAMEAMARVGVNAHMTERSRREKLRRGLVRWRMSRGDASWLRGLLKLLSQKGRIAS